MKLHSFDCQAGGDYPCGCPDASTDHEAARRLGSDPLHDPWSMANSAYPSRVVVPERGVCSGDDACHGAHSERVVRPGCFWERARTSERSLWTCPNCCSTWPKHLGVDCLSCDQRLPLGVINGAVRVEKAV
jgi:hypothetical protein